MRVLVTGARLPVAREIARALADQGCEVIAADSVYFAFTGWSRYVRRYFRHSSPAFDRTAFEQEILELVRHERIELVIPVSEEIFHLASFRDRITSSASFLGGDILTLRSLHSKYEFIDMVKDPAVLVPETRRATTRSELEAARRDWGEIVIKGEFSRGAFGALIRPDAREIERLATPGPWVAQRFVRGAELSTYGIAWQGRLLAHAVYHPRYRIGTGAGVYFDPVKSQDMEDFTRRFVAGHGFTGQIAFDVLRSEDGKLHILECNPRATSGAHLLERQTLGAALLGREAPPTCAPRPRMAGPAMLGLVLPTLERGQIAGFLRDGMAARDVVLDPVDPLPAISQIPATMETYLRSRRWGVGLARAYTMDLEWNGEGR